MTFLRASFVVASLLVVTGLQAASPYSQAMLLNPDLPRTDVSVTVLDNAGDPLPDVLVIFQGFEQFWFVSDVRGVVHLNLDDPLISGPFAASHGWIGAYPRDMEFAVLFAHPDLPGDGEYRVFAVDPCVSCEGNGRGAQGFTHRLGTGNPYTVGDSLDGPASGFADGSTGGTVDESVTESSAAEEDLYDYLNTTENPIDQVYVSDVGGSCGSQTKVVIDKVKRLACKDGTKLACVQYDNGHAPGGIDYSGDNEVKKDYKYSFSNNLTAKASATLGALGVSFGASGSSSGSTSTSATTNINIRVKIDKDLGDAAVNRCGEVCLRTRVTEITLRTYKRTCTSEYGVEIWSSWQNMGVVTRRIVTGWCVDLSGLKPCN